MDNQISNPPVLYICVVGFHHKKGCQLEFCYPPLPEENRFPEEWKTLPSLALPDGAHNYERDTVFFHLPATEFSGNEHRTIFGISCFRQVPTDSVKNRTDDMTRSAVQKAVCVLTALPLFGYIQIKMELVTSAFFENGDFSQVGILKNAYHHLNECLINHFDAHKFDGLSARDLVVRFRHRALLLFKLLLLERRVIFFNSPVDILCSTLLTVVSLVPKLLESGLDEAAFSSLKGGSLRNSPSGGIPPETNAINTHSSQNPSVENNEPKANAELALDALLIEDYYSQDQQYRPENSKPSEDLESPKNDVISNNCDVTLVANIDYTACGMPLQIFTKRYLCYPYLSISYFDLLASNEVRGYWVGASNVLFKQKRELNDVLVDLDGFRIETQCPDLRKQLSLTTEDLRFADVLIRGVLEPRNITIPGIGVEGDENWIRAHFAIYLLSMLRTSLSTSDNGRDSYQFNSQFVSAWKNTHNYKMWLALDHPGIWELNPGHPSSGSLSVSDVRLRFSQAMSSDSGRKLNQAVTNTGKAVGGAITQAKGVISGWWSNFTTASDSNGK